MRRAGLDSADTRLASPASSTRSMIKKTVVFPAVLLVLVLYCGASEQRQQRHTCIHGHRGDELTRGVRLSPGEQDHAAAKRQATEPIRFSPFYDATVTSNPDSNKRDMIQEVVPAVLAFFSGAVSVVPTPSPVRLDRTCSGGYYAPEGGSNVRRCVNQCLPTVCGTVSIPDSHLKRCIECRNSDPQSLQCSPGVPSTDGAGVANTDFILYISANPCAQGQTLAFAAACQTESQLDRPIAGYINFCSNNLGGTTRDFLFGVAKHELFHALAFSSSLMPLWRDSTGSPRTPPQGDQLRDQISPNTLTTLDYTDWDTLSGPRVHTVTVLVTEAVLREGRAHFGCGDLQGVELENQGGNGTALQHWEKRVLGNEAMTGIFDFNPVFSRLSLAVLEDSGWYSVDYERAQPLLWGRQRGCQFVRNGCGDMLDEEPFCGKDIGDRTLGCTLDRGSVATCSLLTLKEDVPPDYRYLPDNMGGSLEIADYCPYYRGVSRPQGRTGNCTNSQNQPTSTSGEDVFGETYGQNSVCLRQGRSWRKTEANGRMLTVQQYGGGCYGTRCTAREGLSVFVRGASFQCECEGQELVVNVVACNDIFTGSVVCPSCSSVCGDLCPSPEPAACPGTVKTFPQVKVNCTTTPSSSPVPATLPILSLVLLVLVGTIMQ